MTLRDTVSRGIEHINGTARYVRWFHEFFFSVNLAWMFEWYDRQQGHPGLFPWMEYSPFLKRLYAHVGMIESGVVLEQVVWSVTLALLPFVILRLLAFFSPTRLFLKTIGGAVAVLGFPVFYLIIAKHTFYGLGSGTRAPWVWLEFAAALVCCVLYYFRKLPLPIGIALLVLHFVFWGRAAGSWSGIVAARSYAVWTPAFWIVALFHGGFPIIGMMSSLAWGKYLKVECGTSAKTQRHGMPEPKPTF